MSRPATRLLMLLEVLQDHPGIGGAALAERLEVDPRTVRRYAERLQELGIPVEAERGRHGGYRLRPGYRLPPLMLDDGEATAVVLALVAARRAGMAGAAPSLETALAKIRRVLPVALRDKAAALEEQLGFVEGAAGPPPGPAVVVDPAVLATLAQAARDRRRVRITHTTARGTASERELDPWGVVHADGRWYVTGHDGLRDAVRTFRVDRISGARRLPGPAAIAAPERFDPVAQVTRTLVRGPWEHPCVAWVDGTAEDVRRWFGATAVEVSGAPGGGVEVRAQVDDLDGFARMLALLDRPFAVREPDALRDAVAALAARLRAAAAAAS